METTKLKDILTGYQSDKLWAGDYAYTGRLGEEEVEVYVKATVALMEGRSYTRGGGWELEVYIDGRRRATWSFSRTKRAALGKAVKFLQKYQEEAKQAKEEEEAKEQKRIDSEVAGFMMAPKETVGTLTIAEGKAIAKTVGSNEETVIAETKAVEKTIVIPAGAILEGWTQKELNVENNRWFKDTWSSVTQTISPSGSIKMMTFSRPFGQGKSEFVVYKVEDGSTRSFNSHVAAMVGAKKMENEALEGVEIIDVEETEEFEVEALEIKDPWSLEAVQVSLPEEQTEEEAPKVGGRPLEENEEVLSYGSFEGWTRRTIVFERTSLIITTSPNQRVVIEQIGRIAQNATYTVKRYNYSVVEKRYNNGNLESFVEDTEIGALNLAKKLYAETLPSLPVSTAEQIEDRQKSALEKLIRTASTRNDRAGFEQILELWKTNKTSELGDAIDALRVEVQNTAECYDRMISTGFISTLWSYAYCQKSASSASQREKIRKSQSEMIDSLVAPQGIADALGRIKGKALFALHNA